jgi:hypothetical protein
MGQVVNPEPPRNEKGGTPDSIAKYGPVRYRRGDAWKASLRNWNKAFCSCIQVARAMVLKILVCGAL